MTCCYLVKGAAKRLLNRASERMCGRKIGWAQWLDNAHTFGVELPRLLSLSWRSWRAYGRQQPESRGLLTDYEKKNACSGSCFPVAPDNLPWGKARLNSHCQPDDDITTIQSIRNEIKLSVVMYSVHAQNDADNFPAHVR